MRIIYTCMLALLVPFISNAQFTTNVNATALGACDPGYQCFRLTTAALNQKGSVFNNTPLNLNASFTLNTKLYFGAFDSDGADGIAFVLQREGVNYIGNYGAGIGYHRFGFDVPGPVPSFIFEFDTWENHFVNGSDIGDIAQDHVAFQKNSDAYHTGANSLQGPSALSANIEDNLWHDATFEYTYTNATTQSLKVTFKTTAVTTQVFTYTGNIISIVGGTNAYWGFTASTGQGSSFTGNEHKVAIQTTPPPPPTCGQLRTQTMGGWGAEPEGNNPGTYLHANFASAFPAGLRVGSSPNFNALFTTAQAITNFLPSGGKSEALAQNYVNPASGSPKNTMMSQIVALSLSVRFDATDPNFGQAGVLLGDMFIGSGTFNGWTVSQFLAEANKVLGGGVSAYTVTQINETATSINENYVDGKVNKGFLTCASARGVNPQTVLPVASELVQVNIGVQPNPSRGNFALRMKNVEGKTQVVVTNSNGTVVETRTVNVQEGQAINFDLGKQAAGLYMVKVIDAIGNVQTQKVLIQK